MEILDRIDSPSDIKNCSIDELNLLAKDIRKGILNRVDKIGGHLGPDLGIVEATIALHYVFNSPKDKFVFDVSHQCYPHKMLTGRKEGFFNDAKLKDTTGYFAPDESNHDTFMIGHTSTSISLATGIAKARDIKKEKYNVIALIGDGSLSGGEAYEGLNCASELKTNFIIIVNDNEMSIAPNYGGLYKNLEDLRRTQGTHENNFFKALGFEYLYVEEGNDIEKLIETFNEVKDIEKPIVVHIHTLKGKGYKPAEEQKEAHHWNLAGFIQRDKENTPIQYTPTYDSITTDFLLRKKMENEPVVVITPATPGVSGFYQDFRDKMGENYIDVGIAEEHAVAYASALAKYGAKPVLAIMSSFIQRTYDQLSQDLALNHSPATILVYWGTISANDATHLGIFDIPLISNIPNITYLAPTNKEEYLAMLEYSLNNKNNPIAIRVPYSELVSTGIKDSTDYSIIKSKIEQTGSGVAFIGAGNFYYLAKECCMEFKNKTGIQSTLINPVFLTHLDKELLEKLKQNHKVIVTLEDGCLSGGFGEKISRFYSSTDMKVLNYGASKKFTNNLPLDFLYEKFRLKKELIIEDVLNLLK